MYPGKAGFVVMSRDADGFPFRSTWRSGLSSGRSTTAGISVHVSDVSGAYPSPTDIPRSGMQILFILVLAYRLLQAAKEKKSQRTYQACQKCRQWKAKVRNPG
jgi:hypothetical protein